jgi:hypothetical protein
VSAAGAEVAFVVVDVREVFEHAVSPGAGAAGRT